MCGWIGMFSLRIGFLPEAHDMLNLCFINVVSCGFRNYNSVLFIHLIGADFMCWNWFYHIYNKCSFGSVVITNIYVTLLCFILLHVLQKKSHIWQNRMLINVVCMVKSGFKVTHSVVWYEHTHRPPNPLPWSCDHQYTLLYFTIFFFLILVSRVVNCCWDHCMIAVNHFEFQT